MLLADVDLRAEINRSPEGGLRVDGLVEGAIGPCSVDLMLANHFHHFLGGEGAIDPKADQSDDGWPVTVPDDDYYLLAPKAFCLASTRERWRFPDHRAGQLEGKSSLARLGLLVHVTAGFFDAGFEGYPTLELFNLRDRPMRLYPGMPVAQMAVFAMTSPALRPYAGKYVDQGAKPAPSMYHKNWG